jgi:hypothetical protein
MNKRLAITDVTRMYEGRVCVAGCDENGVCVRPVLPPPGIFEDSLCVRGRPVVFPFALVQYDLVKHIPQPPHTEDYVYDPRNLRLIRRLRDEERRSLLDRTVFAAVEEIFEAPIISGEGLYIVRGQGVRSLGTIQPRRICQAVHQQSPDGRWKHRLHFVDRKGSDYWLTVTDLTWRYYFNRERSQGRTPRQISAHLTSALAKREVFVRIGLARGWERFPDRCHLQVTGIYSFPDYLDGRTFADLAVRQ